jgi:cyclophilin family peptidyl-prolyl cis-trans isomerase
VIGAIPASAADDDRAIIVASLEDRDVVVRATALSRLGEEPFRGLVPEERLKAALDAARNDVTNDALLAAVEALAARVTPGRDAWLASLRSAPDPVVRRVAVEKLQLHTGRRLQYTPLPVDRALAEYESIVRWAAQPHTATIRTRGGSLKIELLARDAPLTAWNFATLAAKGYFDGTTFMRVVPNFVIQGGDPRNDMSGGPGYSIRCEINERRFARGALGMALSGLDTGGSQFFVTHSPQPHLDGGYTIFGRVVSGMDAVGDRIERGDLVEWVRIDGEAPGARNERGMR